jgi:CDP-diacylglycerol--serine O-phosphatidyltransferase
MRIKNNIPNLITLGNLLCGCLAIAAAFKGHLVWSAYFVGVAAVLDFLDGFVARLLKVSGELGKQLDSLADMVTFGVVPGVVMYTMLLQCTKTSFMDANTDNNYNWLACIGFLMTIFSAVRLAKFNIDTRQTNSFIGVPTPANTILICSIPLINHYQPHLADNNIKDITQNFYFLISITVVMSYLLIAELPLFALKFKTFKWEDNKIRFSFLLISVLLIALLQFIAIPFIIVLYIILSLINNNFNKNEIQSRN